MKRILYLILVIAGISLIAMPLPILKVDKKIWTRIDSLEGAGLYKSALALTDQIYAQVKNEADPENEIKALIYRLKYTQELEEDGPVAAIRLLEAEMPDERMVQGSLKYSMLAELYYRFYSANRWQISQNPDEGNQQPGDPLKTWSPGRFYSKIFENYRKSLALGDQLASVRVSSLPELWSGSLADTLNKSSLYDILMSRLLDFTGNSGEFALPYLKPAELCTSEPFSEHGRFANLFSKNPSDDQNPYRAALYFYGNWLSRLTGTPLLAADLRRLNFMHEKSCHPQRDSLYELALRQLFDKPGADSSSTMVCEAIAQYHTNRSGLYQINGQDTHLYSKENSLAAEWLGKVGKWGWTRAGKRCGNMLGNLLKPELSVQSEPCQIPLTAFPVSIEYKNLTKLSYKVFRINALKYYSDWDNTESAEKLGRLASMKAIRSGQLALPDNGDLNHHRFNAVMDPLPAGFFLIVFCRNEDLQSADNLVATVPVSVSGTTLISRPGSGGSRSFYFRDRNSGAPLQNLVVVPWYNLYDQEGRRTIMEKGTTNISGAEGFLEIPDGGPGRDDPSPKSYRLEIINKGDTLVTRDPFYPGYRQGKAVTRTSLVIYTDRSLYKPGELVSFRGVMVDYRGDSMMIHRGDSVLLKLQDPRYQVLTEMKFPVDSLGVFSGSVPLPYKGLTGNYILQSQFGVAIIRMEQYRRPAFSVKLMRDNEIFRSGDTIRVSGKLTALSGEPVAGAEISADIDIQPISRPGRWMPDAGGKIRLLSLKTKADEQGLFTCKWVSIPDGSSPFGNSTGVRYSILVKATDLNGETHQEETLIDCGKGIVSLSLSVKDKILQTDSLDADFSAYGTDGRQLSLPAKLVVTKLADPSRTWIEPVLPEPDRFIVTRTDWQKRKILLPYKNEHLPANWAPAGVVFEKIYSNDSATQVMLPPTGKWQRGWYKVEVAPVDPKICKTAVRYLFIEDPDPAKVDNATALFARPLMKKLKPGEVMQVNLGTGQKEFVMIDLQKRGAKMIPVWYSTDKKIRGLSWKVTDNWQGGALIHIIMVGSNRIFEENIQLSVPWTHSELTITGFEQIDKVRPGDSIRLKLKVRDEKGAPVRASIGITVYDASLDLINPHNWTRIGRHSFYGGPYFTALNEGVNGSYTLAEPNVKYEEVAELEPLSLNWYGLGYYGIGRLNEPMLKMAMAQPEGAKGRSGADEARAVADVKVGEEEAPVIEKEGKEADEVVIRKDFRETAVFEGNVVTGKDGDAEIHFKIPEVFTEWKLMVTGHDGKLAFGNVDHRFRSSKDLMLRPYLPEFVRTGDTVEFSARLGWYGKGSQNTVTSLKITDSSGNPVKAYPDQKSSLTTGQVVPFTWPFTVGKSGLLRYTVQSTSDGPSDGMSDTIKVYPDEVRLWNAQPFFFAKPGKKQLKIEGNPLEAVYEVSTTPAWQILQSLPVVNKNERDCSEYWFSRFYLTCLAGSIADKFPGVAAKFLSDSVPEKQKDRVNQIREWMNPESRGLEMAYVLEKLANLQNQDGFWPWFRGMVPDVFMTQQIIAGFGELRARGVFDVTNIQRGDYMMSHAIRAMDNWMYRQFREIIRLDSISPQKVHLSPMVIHYIYARSFFPGLSLDPAIEIAWMHFNERIAIEWTQHDPGLQALMAIASIQLGRKAKAMPIFLSLRERSKTDEQWGIFWPRKGYASSWFNWDLWMQSRMIELFAGLEEGRKDLDQLKIYLIHQKRGRDWGNGMVAAWAAKSLLFYGTRQTIEPASVAMKWGSEEYSPLRIKTGSMGVTGYYRYEWKDPKDMPQARNMEITQSGGGPAWGTLFTLNNYKLDKLASNGGPLTINRTVYLRDKNGRWNGIKEGQVIKVGDVIRIAMNIGSDRELSYIEIKDFLPTGCRPLRVLSGYRYQGGVSFYQSREPESVVFYLSELPKGSVRMDYEAVVEQAGSYFGGYSTATSLYAPEFRGWSNSLRLKATR